MIIECLKARTNQGLLPDMYFFRDSNGNEVDLVFQDGRRLVAVDIKAGSTFSDLSSKRLIATATVVVLTELT